MSEPEFDETAWREELLEHRRRKDEFFAEHAQSPLPREEREEFDGLDYYEPDPEYRVEATVELVEGDSEARGASDSPSGQSEATESPRKASHDAASSPRGDTVEVERTAGDTVEYERVARLQFELDGEEHALAAYRTGNDEGLFVPFRDATSGEETYGAGRYMEFEVDGELEDGDTIPLDFNLAYSPFCAYNEAFTCPIPPRENRLDAPIEAGERYEGGKYASAH